MIKNEAKIKLGLIRKVREQLEHRAMWLALLCIEAEKKGLKMEDFARDAVFNCGCIQGANLNRTKKEIKTGCVVNLADASFKTLKKNLFSVAAQWMFEMKIRECTDDKLSIDFHYCPLVKAWQKMGLDDAMIAKLCDTAMCGDRGIAHEFGGVLNLEKVIAKGDDYCKIRFTKNKE